MRSAAGLFFYIPWYNILELWYLFRNRKYIYLFLLYSVINCVILMIVSLYTISLRAFALNHYLRAYSSMKLCRTFKNPQSFQSFYFRWLFDKRTSKKNQNSVQREQNELHRSFQSQRWENSLYQLSEVNQQAKNYYFFILTLKPQKVP